MGVDLSVFDRIKTKQDYDRLNEEFLQRKALGAAKIQNLQDGGNDPAAIKEWHAYNQLSPQDKENYLQMKRADKVLNLGGSQAVLSPTGGISEEYEVTPKPEQMPDFKANVRQAESDVDLNMKPIIAGNVVNAQEDARTGSIVERERTEAMSEAQLSLPQSEENAAYMNELLDKIKTHEGLDSGTGLSSIIPAFPGTKRKSFDVLLDQVKGKQFMTAYQTLKGGGQITEVEGNKATEALARMNAAQTEEDFLEAVADFQGVVNRALEKQRMLAGGGAPQPSQLDPRNIPMKAAQYLKQNPNTAAQFDQKYGAGASKMVIGQ